MVAAWDTHYAKLDAPMAYGGDASYRHASEFMRGHGLVEDWGCGGGYLRTMIDGPYRGIDGSRTPFADVIADLADYTSMAECIVIRHVLEHSYRWQRILDNACASFRSRLCVILFTPLAEETHVLQVEPDYCDVPVIAFRLTDLLERVPPECEVAVEHVPGSFYGMETIIKAVRP